MILQVSFSKHKSSLPFSSQRPSMTGTQRIKQILSQHKLYVGVTQCNCVKNLKRWKISLNFNAKRCAQAKMSCELDKHSVLQSLRVGRALPVFPLIHLHIRTLEMQEWSHPSTSLCQENSSASEDIIQKPH